MADEQLSPSFPWMQVDGNPIHLPHLIRRDPGDRIARDDGHVMSSEAIGPKEPFTIRQRRFRSCWDGYRSERSIRRWAVP